MSKNIGAIIVSQLNHTNYGSFLQAYATINFVKNLGYNLSIIHYKKKRSIKDWIKIGPKLLISGGLESLQISFKRKFQEKKYTTYKPNQKIRIEATNKLKYKEFIPLVKEYIGFDNLREGSKKFNLVFVGSDQVWKPWGFYSYYWNLLFVDEQVPKFSYASSFGVSKIPWIQKKGTKKYLERLNMISVREIQGKNIVETLSNKYAELVVDPTMLLTPEEWRNFYSDSSINLPKEKYIFCYFLGKREEGRIEALKFAKENNLKIVIMRHMDEYVPIEENMGDYAPYDVNGKDFLKLLDNAEYVLTDSFHGTVFSILFHKNFITFYRQKQKSIISTNNRIDSLLTNFNLTNRIYKGNLFLEITNKINFEIVDELRTKLCQDSKKFFEKCLKL